MRKAETNLAWLAGVVDGEGCICLFRKKYESGSVSPTANVTVTNTNRALLDAVGETLTELNVKFREVRIRPHSYGKRPISRITIRNYASIEIFLTAILPYMVAKKRQAELMVDFVKGAGARKELNLIERWEMLEDMHRLNSPSVPVETIRAPLSELLQ